MLIQNSCLIPTSHILNHVQLLYKPPYWSVCQLVGLSVGLLICWLVGWAACWLVCLTVGWFECHFGHDLGPLSHSKDYSYSYHLYLESQKLTHEVFLQKFEIIKKKRKIPNVQKRIFSLRDKKCQPSTTFLTHFDIRNRNHNILSNNCESPVWPHNPMAYSI